MTQHSFMNHPKKIVLISLFIYVCVASQNTQAQVFALTEPPSLKIEIVNFDQAEIETFSRLTIQSACETFGKHLLNNNGPLGTGAFKAYRCDLSNPTNIPMTQNQSKQPTTKEIDKKQPTSAKNSRKSKNKLSDQKSPPLQQSPEWVLRVSKQTSGMSFEAILPNQKTALSLLNIEDSEEPLSLIADDKLGPIIAHHLSTALPIRSSITGNDLQKGQKFGGKINGVPNTNLPKVFSLFELSINNTELLPTIVGAAQMIENKDNNDVVNWSISSVSGKIDSKKTYYIQQPTVRITFLNESSSIINEMALDIQNTLLANKRAADIGVRLGIPIGSNLGPLSKAMLIGVLAEFRSGPVKGLKVNFDIIPRTNVNTSKGSESFQFSRFQLGYSFGKTVSTSVVNWMDVTPRLGLTNLNTESTIEAQDGGSNVSFRQTRAPTLGIEFGLEKRKWSLLLRSWFYASYSFSFLPIDKNFQTVVLRAGLDLYKDILEIGDGSLSVLGFSWLDSTRISRRSSNEESENTAKSLEYRVIYVGTGLTYSW